MTVSHLLDELVAVLQEEQTLLHYMESRRALYPSGYLVKRCYQDEIQYYRVDKTKEKRPYVAISTRHADSAVLLSELASKSMVRRSIPLLQKNILALRRFLKVFRPFHPASLPFNEWADRNLFPRESAHSSLWIPASSFADVPHPESRIHDTKQGELVRSKSEVLIANTLFDFHIPYLYEHPLPLEGVTIHPDFTLARPSDGCLVIWEHFGLVEDSRYQGNAIAKLKRYARAGFHLGDNLIASWESLEHPLTFRAIREELLAAGFASDEG